LLGRSVRGYGAGNPLERTGWNKLVEEVHPGFQDRNGTMAG
jgi:hypothetical protein